MSRATANAPVVKNLAYGILASSIDADDTVLALGTGQGAKFPVISASENVDRWCPLLIVPGASPDALNLSALANGEYSVCTARASGSDSLTVVRGAGASAHSAGELVIAMVTADVLDSYAARLDALEALVAILLSGGAVEGVGRFGDDATRSLKTTVAAGQMYFDVEPGFGVGADGLRTFYLAEAWRSPTFVAPAASTRHDLVVFTPNLGELEVVEGTEGAGDPAVPADSVAIWRVVIPTTATQIKAATDGTNGYLEDLRSWL